MNLPGIDLTSSPVWETALRPNRAVLPFGSELICCVYTVRNRGNDVDTLRIDFMFSGTFLEEADAEFVSTMLRSPKLIRFDFNEDMMNEDLTMNLQDHGLENEQIEWVSSEHACFIDPTELDDLTSKEQGYLALDKVRERPLLHLRPSKRRAYHGCS